MTATPTQPAPLDDAGAMAVLAADAAIARALRDVKQLPGERDDFWLARVRAHAAERLATNASAGFAWNGHMVHGDKASIEAVMAMVRAEAELAAVRDTWRPIETAPRDGSVIVVCHKRGTWLYPKDPQRINCVVVFWDGGRFEEFGPDSFRPSELTHWMPLPMPPAVDAARGAG